MKLADVKQHLVEASMFSFGSGGVLLSNIVEAYGGVAAVKDLMHPVGEVYGKEFAGMSVHEAGSRSGGRCCDGFFDIMLTQHSGDRIPLIVRDQLNNLASMQFGSLNRATQEVKLKNIVVVDIALSKGGSLKHDYIELLDLDDDADSELFSHIIETRGLKVRFDGRDSKILRAPVLNFAYKSILANQLKNRYSHQESSDRVGKVRALIEEEGIHYIAYVPEEEALYMQIYMSLREESNRELLEAKEPTIQLKQHNHMTAYPHGYAQDQIKRGALDVTPFFYYASD